MADFRKSIIWIHFPEWMKAQNLRGSVERSGQPQLLVKDGDHQMGADFSPCLGLQRLGTRSMGVRDADGHLIQRKNSSMRQRSL